MSLFVTQKLKKNALTDQNLTFPFIKHEIFGGVFGGGIFFGTLRRSKDAIFHEKKNIHKILLDLFRK